MRFGHTNLVLRLLAKRLFALKLLLGHGVHGPEGSYLRHVLLQRVVWVYGFVRGGSVMSRILQDDLLASWVLLWTLQWKFEPFDTQPNVPGGNP